VFIFNIRTACLGRVIITSLLYLTHPPANLLYELCSWKRSSSLDIQGTPYFPWTESLRTVPVRTRRRWLFSIQSTVSRPIYVKKSIFIYSQLFQQNCTSYFYHTCYVPCPSPLPYFNPLNAEINPTCLLLALLGAHHIFHVSRIRVNRNINNWRIVNSRVRNLFIIEHCSVNLFLHLIGVRSSSLVLCPLTQCKLMSSS
jgi:hypothetical protein